MGTYGDSLRPQRVGVGFPATQLPPATPVTYGDFSAGLIRSSASENIPPNASPYAVDMEVAEDGALQTAPGVLQLEDATPHQLRWIFEHASIDPESALVAVAPPFLGVKGAAGFMWTNHAISAQSSEWTAAGAIGELLLSNGRATYHRTFAGVLTDITAEITARAFGTAFGRVFAGGYWADGREQSLGLRWNTASNTNPLTNWSTEGAGAEFLLGDEALPDRIMAIKAIGFDVMGILNRHSLWAGHPTGQAARPADLRLRFSGIGCISARTVASTPWGIVFLSDEGVALYDVNQVGVISDSINADLLPLDEDNLDAYTGAYDPSSQRYILTAPHGTWVHEFAQPGRPARWFHRSTIMDGVWHFGLVAGVAPEPPSIYYSRGTLFGREARQATALGTALTPVWRTPEMAKDQFTGDFTTIGLRIQYSSAELPQTLEIWMPGDDEVYALTATVVLPATGRDTRRRNVDFVHTGRGISLELRPAAASTELHIKRVQQLIRYAGTTGNA